tara:strand:+ start:987 stop:1298 length:312 start_codon:yes stop_codon:yes gene_type:complete
MNNNKNQNDEFKLLRKIGLNPNSSQRDLAQQLGFSLGKLNYCLKALKKKGLVKIKNFKNNPDKSYYVYLLTPKGISHKSKMAYYFMKQKAKEYEELKKEVYKK